MQSIQCKIVEDFDSSQRAKAAEREVALDHVNKEGSSINLVNCILLNSFTRHVQTPRQYPSWPQLNLTNKIDRKAKPTAKKSLLSVNGGSRGLLLHHHIYLPLVSALVKGILCPPLCKFHHHLLHIIVIKNQHGVPLCSFVGGPFIETCYMAKKQLIDEIVIQHLNYKNGSMQMDLSPGNHINTLQSRVGCLNHIHKAPTLQKSEGSILLTLKCHYPNSQLHPIEYRWRAEEHIEQTFAKPKSQQLSQFLMCILR